MINPQITLKSKTYSLDSVGNQIETIVDSIVPIIRIENIYASEFYNASQSNFKPELRLVISSYNYDDQNEFEYNSKDYSIIRTENANQDELVIVAERKLKNVDN